MFHLVVSLVSITSVNLIWALSNGYTTRVYTSCIPGDHHVLMVVASSLESARYGQETGMITVMADVSLDASAHVH